MSKDYYQDEEFEGFEDFEEMEQELYEENEEWEPDTEEEDDDREPRRRRHHRGLKIFAGILVVITLALAGIIYGFRLEEVRVIGNKNYTVEEIKSLMGFPEDAPNTLFVYLRFFRYKVKDIPFIDRIDVKIENRNMICIEVSEKDILGCFKKGKTYFYFDDSGVIQESLSEKKEKVPVIRGAKTGNLEIGAQISMEDQNVCHGIMELGHLLLNHGITAEKIEIDENKHFTVCINDNIRAALGTPVLLEEKTSELANILPELRQMEESEQICGVLHLENYDSTKNSIIFTKEN